MGLFFIFSIACAVAQNTAQLAVFRFISGLGGGAPLAIGAGVLADIWEAKERGKAIAIFSLGPPIAPTIAPIIAGFISLRTTWRWVMWVLTFATGFTFVFGILFLRETFAPIILAGKAKRLRKETGNNELQTLFQATEEGESLWHKIGKNLIRPAKLLTGNVIVFVLSLYMALAYGMHFIALQLTLKDTSTSFSRHFPFFLRLCITRTSALWDLTISAWGWDPYSDSVPHCSRTRYMTAYLRPTMVKDFPSTDFLHCSSLHGSFQLHYFGTAGLPRLKFIGSCLLSVQYFSALAL